ncbi:MAG: matrixin family metalloprotease [Labilithrix sp.]|nr:matrixin family metalloprotease [Labilithrix sp.]MBX3224631.1 matrixin family metalloprotease [Labilithrix sp.]
MVFPEQRTKRGSVGRRAAAAVAALGLLAVASDAAAFCRSTTCRTTKDKECPTDADGCSTDGAKLFWPTSCISYATNRLGTSDLDPADTRAIIRKTFQAWSDVDCADGTVAAMTFQEREPVSCKKSQYNKTGPNVNVVLFQDSNWKYRGIDGTLAKTSVTYNDETGEIYDADIEVNTANNEVTITDDPAKVQYDLQAILTHEVGHFIGVAHSPDPGAVMFASYSPGSMTQRELHPDDVAAVCGIYPENGGVACNTEPRNGFSAECDDPEPKGLCSVQPASSGVSYGALAIVLGSGLVAARARRRNNASMTSLTDGGRR